MGDGPFSEPSVVAPIRGVVAASLIVSFVCLAPRQLDAEVRDCPLSPAPSEAESHGPNASVVTWSRTTGTDYAVSVTPDGGGEQRQQGTSGHMFVFTIINTGLCEDSYSIVVSKNGTIASASVNPSAVWLLAPSAQTTVTVTYSVGSSPGGVITVTATGSFGVTDNGTVHVTVVPPPGAPIVDLTSYTFETQNYGRCAVSCFAATHAQSTVPYFSLNAPRNVTLVYNGDRVNPAPFVHVDVSPDPGYGQTPTEYQLQVKVNGVLKTFVNGESTLRSAYGGTAAVRIGGQFDASGSSTGMYTLEILVSAKYGGALIVNANQTKLMIVNETSSPIARGWTLAGVQRLYLHGDSVLITEGDGSAVYFRKDNGQFVTPPAEFSKLVSGMPGGGLGWTRLYPDSTKVVFNSAGRMTEVRDRFNNTTTITYDGSNRVSKIRDPLNLPITLTYNANGLSTITDTMGRVTTVTVDASKRLTAIRDPDNVSTTFGYDVPGLRLSTITNRRGHTTTLGYDSQSGKLGTITPPAVEVVNADGSLTTASPVTTLEAWQKRGVPYGSTGTPVAAPLRDTVYGRTTDPGGHTGRFTVNRWGTPAVVTDQLGRTDSTRFDGNGMPIRTRYATGAIDTAVYNGNGLPTWIKQSGYPATNIRYGGWAQADSIWRFGDSSGVRRFIRANGRVDWERVAGGTPDSAVTRYRYDSRGRPDSVLDAMNHLIGRSWYLGLNGNRSKDSLPGRQATYSYDAYGRDTSVSRFGYATTRTFYSIINRTDSIRDGVSPKAIRYAYDNMLLTSVTDARNQVYGFTYNALGWLTQRTDPAGRSDVYKYDRDGQRRRWTNRRGHIITYTYDTGHRPSQKSGDSTSTESWAYPSDTAVVTTVVTNGIQTSQDTAIVNRHGQAVRASTVIAGQVFPRRYVYTSVGLLDSVIPSGGGVAFHTRKYKRNSRSGNLEEIRLGTDTTRFVNNSDGLPTMVILPGADTVFHGYTPGHAEGAVTIGGPAWGVALTRYLNIGAQGIIEHILGSGQQGRRYTYDGLGRLKTDSAVHWQGPPPPCAGQRNPELDDNGSVCVADEFGGGIWVADSGVQFSYDSAGNRSDKGGVYLVGNRIQQFDGCTYQTDFDGNVTQRVCGADTVKFRWSTESRLIGMTTSGKTLAFYYDTQGQLVRKDINGSPQAYFVWDQGQVLVELDGSATKRAEYSYYHGADVPHAVLPASETWHAHRDGIGNVIGLTDTSVTLRGGYTYDAWGRTVSSGPDTLNRARFKGALWLGSELDIYFMRARWYDPQTGRFLSEDPIGIEGGLNLYTFASNDPINCFERSHQWKRSDGTANLRRGTGHLHRRSSDRMHG
jgi:RHS repeat-associated protein